MKPGTQSWLAHHPEEAAALARFTDLMADELAANDGKGNRPGWMTMNRQEAIAEVHWHASKLAVAAKDYERSDGEPHYAEKVTEFGPDVANCALMALDVMGLLGAHEIPTPEASIDQNPLTAEDPEGDLLWRCPKCDHLELGLRDDGGECPECGFSGDHTGDGWMFVGKVSPPVVCQSCGSKNPRVLMQPWPGEKNAVCGDSFHDVSFSPPVSVDTDEVGRLAEADLEAIAFELGLERPHPEMDQEVKRLKAIVDSVASSSTDEVREVIEAGEALGAWVNGRFDMEPRLLELLAAWNRAKDRALAVSSSDEVTVRLSRAEAEAHKCLASDGQVKSREQGLLVIGTLPKFRAALGEGGEGNG